MASKILLADDSITIQKVVNLTFADEGIDVITVSNGEMAERRLSEINPDLVLADIFMPGKNGYELCQFIKDTPPFQNIPVVLLVGAFEPFDQSEARRVRADGHLTKPFESRTLVETVRKLIQTSRTKTGPARQAQAKQPQPVRETRPLSPEPEQHQNAFIDISQIVSDGSEQTASQNGAPPPGAPAQAAPTGADPLAVDYHGLWEIGTSTDQRAESNAGAAGDISFGIDLGNGEAPNAAQPSPVFPQGFEISAPETSPPETAPPESQPTASGFEFGFSEPAAGARQESQESREPHVAQVSESGQGAIPFPQSNGAQEPATGFAVPSLFSNTADQVLDFRQVDAPEQPPSASEVSFELSPAPLDPPEPAANLDTGSSVDGKYFDLIPQERPAAAAAEPEAVQRSAQPAGVAGEGGPRESGFDLTGLAATSDRGPALVEEEPLGDVFSQDKPSSTPQQETSFAIADEAVNVDVRPPAGESFRMVLPPAPETEFTGAWPQLGSDQSGASGSSPNGGEAPGIDFNDQLSHERSFAIAEARAVETPFDPMELRAGEPTEEPATAPVQTDFRQEPSEQFTSSLMWSEEAQPSPPTPESVPLRELSDEVLAPLAESVEAGVGNQLTGASAPGFGPAGDHLPGSTPVVPPSGPEVLKSSFGPADGAVVENKSEAPSVPSGVDLPASAIEDIVRRVVLEMSDAVIRELAWEILPDCVERVVEKLARESLAKKP